MGQKDRTGAAERVLDAVRRHPGCELDAILRTCPELTWTEILSEINHLCAKGSLTLSRTPHGRYLVSLPQEPVSPLPPAQPSCSRTVWKAVPALLLYTLMVE